MPPPDRSVARAGRGAPGHGVPPGSPHHASHPWAVGVPAALSAGRLQAAIVRPTAGARVLTAVEVVIALVGREYRRSRLHSRAAERDRPATHRTPWKAT